MSDTDTPEHNEPGSTPLPPAIEAAVNHLRGLVAAEAKAGRFPGFANMLVLVTHGHTGTAVVSTHCGCHTCMSQLGKVFDQATDKIHNDWRAGKKALTAAQAAPVTLVH
jgi:hypothetical protein